jgi:hypothetical protein
VARSARSCPQEQSYNSERLLTFTFNDTVVIAYVVDRPTVESIGHKQVASHMLRGFQALSINRGILFRGAFAVGDLYRADREKNIIMGPAVSDAAAWYDKSDWIGVSATPHATILFDGLIPQLNTNFEHLLIPYEVPFKDGRKRMLRCVNWPKGQSVTGLVPDVVGANGKARLRTLLSRQRIPRGTEDKYTNTLAFFDHVYDAQHLSKFEPPQAEPSPPSNLARSRRNSSL